MIKTFEMLMSKRWIIKSTDKELYHRVKDKLPQLRSFIDEKLGYRLIVNPLLIKMEKIPAVPHAWMGIDDFDDCLAYEYLCLVLMFLEDMEPEEQFVLSSLTEFIQGAHPAADVDWTVYNQRRHLIKALRFCINSGMLAVTEGDGENFARDVQTEVLYENTGTSRYFMRMFTRNIIGMTEPQDFLENEWFGMDEERGLIRRQRVYRKVFLNAAVYRESDEDEDFNYIKNYRHILEDDAKKVALCNFQVHKAAAFLIMNSDSALGKELFGSDGLSDIILLWQQEIADLVRSARLVPDNGERITLSAVEFAAIITEFKRKMQDGFTKEYRDYSEEKLCRDVAQRLLANDMIRYNEEFDEYILLPIIGKMVGRYPSSFKGAVE